MTKKPNQDKLFKDDTYALGHTDEVEYAYRAPTGLNEELIRKMSMLKEEPEWMLERRLKALKIYEKMVTPVWGGDLSLIHFEDIHYYTKPKMASATTWDEVPDAIKNTFERIGVPEAEREMLAGVKGQYDSEVIYGSLKRNLSEKGVVFLSMDEGLKQYPDLVKEYFGKVVPIGDNKLAALNSAVWSGGSFVYVPKNVDVGLPLQAYFRINTESAGQFERTLIIADEGSKVHYIEGCFLDGVLVETIKGRRNIREIQKGDVVRTHLGDWKSVNFVQKRSYSGNFYKIKYQGNPSEYLEATEEHPFLIVRRKKRNERNKRWKKEWVKSSELNKGDYFCVPIVRKTQDIDNRDFEIKVWKGKKRGFEIEPIKVPISKDFMKLVGYYLAEGSISGGYYLNFSFSEEERDLIDDVKTLVKSVFGETRIREMKHIKNHGVSVVISSVKLCRIFESFGRKNNLKNIPTWMMYLGIDKQKELIRCWYLGDGNYYHKRHSSGFKEVVRMNTTSEELVYQARDILARLGVPAFINRRDRSKDNRKIVFTLGVTGIWMLKIYDILKINKDNYFDENIKQRASMFGIDGEYIYFPIKEIEVSNKHGQIVYNFGVDTDESYVAGGVAVHNCSAPSFSSASLHSAVVEIFVKKGAKVQYSTVQNWFKNVYNLVTKRAWVEEEAEMKWVDGNLGSRLTMKYPSCVLAGKKSHGELLSVAWAGEGQHQDTGAKMIHLAPETTSLIISKSISKDGGRATYRGMVQIVPGADRSRSKVVCDALILDDRSRSDTYPVNKIMENDVVLEHEATVSRVSEEQLFYLQSRGISEKEASAMIVNGFLDPIIKEIPLEYAVEMNRLVELEMEGSVG